MLQVPPANSSQGPHGPNLSPTAEFITFSLPEVPPRSGKWSSCTPTPLWFLQNQWPWLLLFSYPVMSDSLRPRERQHARLPCPSPSPGVCPSSCSLHC